MGVVSDHLRRLIAKQVDDHGLVVWYDGDGHYRDFAQVLQLPDTKLVRYDDSFFELRHAIEQDLTGAKPPRLVIYVPLRQEATHHALIEAEVAGVVMQPGQQPPLRNTRLAIVARNALRPILGEGTAARIEKQVEAGQLELADLDRMAEQGEGFGRGVLSVLFGSSNPADVALQFLSSDRFDAELASKDAMGELNALLADTFGSDLSSAAAGETPAALRLRLARWVLATDLIASLSGAIPAPLATVKVPSSASARDACVALARTWRLRRDLRDSYVRLAATVESELRLSRVPINGKALTHVETFGATESALQCYVETQIAGSATDDLIEISQQRQSSFWSEYAPDIQARWALIGTCGQLLAEADRIETELRGAPASVSETVKRYTESQRPWCLLDSYHRHLERRLHNFDFDVDGQHVELEKLIAKARGRYMAVGSRMAERFVRSWADVRFKPPGIPRQVEIFASYVKPKLEDGPTAYVWVDALRFEMGRELASALGEEFSCEFGPALATVPPITEIGMAGLVPQGSERPALVPAAEGKLALRVGATTLKDRKDRVKFLKAAAGVEVLDAKLEDLLPSPRKKLREGIAAAKLVLVTSQEIDELGERDNIPLARRTMDDMLLQLRRAFRILASLGIKHIVVAADHGYLFGEELGEDMKIDPPGGQTVDLHRRVWIGRGGEANDRFLRARAADFGLEGDLEIAVPWNFACFKSPGGAEAYFHGGLSPQEVLIPVIRLTSKSTQRAIPSKDILWTLTPGSAKITSRFFSVQIGARLDGLFGPTLPRVRVELRSKAGSASRPVSASYGFDESTGDVQLKPEDQDPKSVAPNTVTLMIEPKGTKDTMSLHLVDAVSGTELQRLDGIELALAI